MGQGEWREIISSDYDMALAGVNSWHLGLPAGDLHKVQLVHISAGTRSEAHKALSLAQDYELMGGERVIFLQRYDNQKVEHDQVNNPTPEQATDPN